MTNKSVLPNISLHCDKVSKTFIHDTIISNVSLDIHCNEIVAITGPNGSGKSTLLQLLSGHSSPSTGTIQWKTTHKTIDIQDYPDYLTMAAPYLELIDDYNVEEMVEFHFGFKAMYPDVMYKTIKHIMEISMLQAHSDKRVKSLSSGMKQRLKLTLALTSASSVVLLDEPTTNLDLHGKAWFADLLMHYKNDRLVCIATNETFDINLCNKVIDVMVYK